MGPRSGQVHLGCAQVNSSIVLDSNYRWLHNVGEYDLRIPSEFDSTLYPNTYDVFKPLNQELTFDVDVSRVSCGINGTLYLSEMIQIEAQNFVNGVVRTPLTRTIDLSSLISRQSWDGLNGACCNEMDTLGSQHCCITGPYTCSGSLCSSGDERYDGVCDEDGCDFNYYGPGKKIDTTHKFTVTAQFLSNNNCASGALSQVRRLYVQDGRVIQNSNTNITGIAMTNHISVAFCAAQMHFLRRAAFPTDPGVARGTFSPFSHLRERNDAGGDVSRRRGVISNIRVGDIGSTY
ncbi:glycoside hydrolase family 7 protein [Oidiodendron maius Zn]|uniref:cellulase n=1 Tax=Oidiodendron maius (strain Zn) TaxID=913774 RepID=A0A0C3DIA8_OIDMZ|nr:glycoside hydrolase family 7 protein [Oidiodendron maius Zn]